MNKPERHDFTEERKIDGKLFKSVNEELYRHSLRKWEKYKRTLLHHPKETT